MMALKSIVLRGGPCDGKSLEIKDIKTVTVPRQREQGGFDQITYADSGQRLADGTEVWTMGGVIDSNDNCECHRCIKENGLTVDIAPGWAVPLSTTKMILCPVCGNKRCPKASDHRLACTGSNAPGQDGSVYN